MPTDAYRLMILALCLLLASCGTNVKELLNEESRTYWRAERIVAAAEDRDPDLAAPLFAAEAEKDMACESLNAAANERILKGEFTFAQQFLSNFILFLVRIFPVTKVEGCAEAYESYNKELVALRRQLEEMGVQLSPPDGEDLGR